MAEDATIKFTLDTAEARKQIDRVKKDLREASSDAGRLGSAGSKSLADQAKAAAGLFGGAALSGASGALSRTGEGATGGALAASQALATSLQQQGQSNLAKGAQEGNLVQTAVGAAQLAAGVAENRILGPIRQAREVAIQQTASLTSGFAQEFGKVDPQLQADIMATAFKNAFRSIQNEAQARKVAPGVDALFQRFQVEGGF